MCCALRVLICDAFWAYWDQLRLSAAWRRCSWNKEDMRGILFILLLKNNSIKVKGLSFVRDFQNLFGRDSGKYLLMFHLNFTRRDLCVTNLWILFYFIEILTKGKKYNNTLLLCYTLFHFSSYTFWWIFNHFSHYTFLWAYHLTLYFLVDFHSLFT